MFLGGSVMRIIPASLLFVLGLVGSIPFAVAQPTPAGQPNLVGGLPVESVTVVGVKPSEQTIRSFVETRAAPTRVLNKMARWDSKVCPLTTGLGKTYAKYMDQRIRDVAKAVGAPVDTDPGCRPNIEVVFTTAPQGFLDHVRKVQPLLLGYHYNDREADQLAAVSHPIKAWYATETIDFDGARMVQDLTCRNSGAETSATESIPQGVYSSIGTNSMAGEAGAAGSYPLSQPCAVAVHSSGSRINNGLSNGFFNVLIVAEPAKLLDYQIGSLADYVVMLALSQPASLDSCQQLPSISNMLAKGCASVPTHITDGDLAYLRALYKMPDGTSLEIQRDEIRLEMHKTLVTDKDR
jgi:hypothetical protein